jgi:hypothetical protein
VLVPSFHASDDYLLLFMQRLVYLEHIGGSVPIITTIARLNDTDQAEYERITAEESSAGWRIAA